MQLDRLALALYGLKQKFGVDSTDVMILHAVYDLRKEQGEVPTMLLLSQFDDISPATVHVRLKKLLESGMLARVGDPTNLRVKNVETTDKTEEMLAFLTTI
jgi:DNA-binding MarR family transcriptional regulator